MTTYFIDNNEALAQICQQISHSPFVAVDTEFMRERTYFARLALIQLATPDVIACVDPLAIDDFGPLKGILLNPDIIKVFHAADQDLEIFDHLFGEVPRPLFDTQMAATILGHGEQVGYAALVKELLDVELDKSHTRTDWLQRPLVPKQIRYAEDDVRYLTRLYLLMQRTLKEKGREDWLEGDFLALTDPGRYRPAPEDAWKKIKGVNKLRGAQLAILACLARWREEQAVHDDVPRRRVANDNVVLDIARLRPKDRPSLEKIRGIPESLINKHGNTLLQCVLDGERLPKEQWPRLPRHTKLTAQQEALVEACLTIVKLCSDQYQLNASSLTNRKELEQLILGERNLGILQGWRHRHGGEQILDFLQGRLVLHVSGNELNLSKMNHLKQPDD